MSVVPNPMTDILLKEKFGHRQTRRKEFHVTPEAEGDLLQLPAKEEAVVPAATTARGWRGRVAPAGSWGTGPC